MSLIYSPGPAAYDLGSTIGKAPAASMKGRPKPADTSMYPAPNSYKLEGMMGREGPKFTLRPKTSVPADLAESPGPGAYNPNSGKAKGITMAPKLNLAGLTDANPGPGAYASPFEVGKDAPKYSMPGRGSTMRALGSSPGPGSYDGSLPKSKIAASMKSRHYDKPDEFAPGPGAYRLADTIGGPGNSPSYTMRPRHSPKAASDSVPSPAHYSIPSSIGTAPKISMTARRHIKSSSDTVPGPGAYKLEGYTGRDGARYTLRPRTSVPADLAESPGPGAYNPSTGKAKGITMSPKIKSPGATDANPGPGAYSSPFEVGKGAPAYSMPGRNANVALRQAASSPGPGAYSSDARKSNIAASMKSRHFDKPDAFAPGPGAYNADLGMTIGASAPKVSMHKKLGDYTFAASTNPPFLPQR